MNNLPAVSDERSMLEFPEARALERDRLLEKVTLHPGNVVLDIQSAAGFLSDEVFRLLDGDVTCYCLEPSDQHRQRLKPQHVPVDDPVECFPKVGSHSIDVAVGLAGLHHSNDHRATLAEVYRVLKPGGQFAICDVLVGSNIASWLNEYVDRNTKSGHKGNFVRRGVLARQCNDVGFCGVTEAEEDVPWHLPSEDSLVRFFKGLFGLLPAEAEVRAAIRQYFALEVSESGVKVPWKLLYVSGRKPG